MGQSGAGKTSLLNILACRVNSSDKITVEGDKKINQKVYRKDYFQRVGVYVMQHDVLMSTLTPKEALMFAAKLKVGGSAEK